MATYTGVADGNGDFIIPFPSLYTGGQKIIVTAEKDSATKSIELFAPSDVIASDDAWISFTTNTPGYPSAVKMSVEGSIPSIVPNSAFDATNNNIFSKAKSLTISSSTTSIGNNAFRAWVLATSLIVPDSVINLGEYSFQNWTSATSLTIGNGVTSIKTACFESWVSAISLIIGSSVTDIYDYAFFGWSSLLEMTVLRATPPTITSTAFAGLNASCIIKVPAASVAAYKTAAGWSAFAARIQAI